MSSHQPCCSPHRPHVPARTVGHTLVRRHKLGLQTTVTESATGRTSRESSIPQHVSSAPPDPPPPHGFSQKSASRSRSPIGKPVFSGLVRVAQAPLPVPAQTQSHGTLV